jgi:PAS domain S-box-containing protein
MKTALDHRLRLLWKFGDDLPSGDGERLACVFRFMVYLLFLVYYAVYRLTTSEADWSHNYSVLVSGTAWFLLNAALLGIIRAGHYRPWMSILSLLADVGVVAALTITASSVYVLNFSSNMLTGLYWVAIALAALRRSVFLVLLAGILSGLSMAVVSVYFFFSLDISQQNLIFDGDHPIFTVTLLDQAAKSVAMVLTGWIVAHVTRQIRSTEKEYQVLFEHVPDGIVLTGKNGEIVTVNRSFSNLLDRPSDGLVGQSVETLFRQNLQSGRENVLCREDAGEIPVAVTGAVFQPHGDETRRIFSVRNMSQQKDLEHQLVQIQKMEALGQLSQGLAHDFNNLLGGILGASSLIATRLSRTPGSAVAPRLSSHLQVITECGENARDILKRLLGFSRSSYRQMVAVDLGSLLDDVVLMARKTFGPAYTITATRRADDPAPVEADESALFQALLNLCMNAREAMPDGGPLDIALSPAGEPEPSGLADEVVLKNRSWWQIRLRDHGAGMTPETIRRSLEPFFSTKTSARRGSGLGLPIAYRIIRLHDGIMKIHSAPGEGTTVDIYLPGISLTDEDRRGERL